MDNQKEDFRKLTPANKAFYQKNHANQTLRFVLKKKEEYRFSKEEKSIWEVMNVLDKFVDESDPDTDHPQSVHAFQTAEAIRKDNHPEWLVLVGLIHDMGKVLSIYGEPQWAVVGDTFPVGCRFSHRIVHYGGFHYNDDFSNTQYVKQLGIYERGCGWENLHFSWGHDEYMYQVLKRSWTKLPEEALYIIRFHSFYAGHQENAYQYFMNAKDYRMLDWLKLFQKYDLYSKDPEPVDIDEILPYYQELVKKYLPDLLKW
jgi:inositol oxygenase